MVEAIRYIWQFVTSSTTLFTFFVMIFTIILKCLIISVYFSLIYCGLRLIKKFLHKKMSARANYYCWSVLIFSVILANLGITDSIKLSFYYLFYSSFYSNVSSAVYVYAAGCILATVWVIIVMHKLAIYVRLNYKIKASLKSMERYDDHEGLLKRASILLSLNKNPDVFITKYIDAPVSYGVFKKTILLPVTFKEKYSSNELFLILLHEMAHIKNFDTVKLHMINLAECFLWITPAIRLFSKQFKRDSEILCDNLVMGIRDCDRDTYGNLILKECVDRNTTIGFGFSDSYHALSNRLAALYRYQPEKHGRVSITAVAIIVLLFISCISYFIVGNCLKINPNSELVMMLTNAELTNVELLDSDVCDGVYYKVTDDDICIDKLALGELAGSVPDGKYDRIIIFSGLYSVHIYDETPLVRGDHYLLSFDELMNIEENSRYYTPQFGEVGIMEAFFLRVTSKL